VASIFWTLCDGGCLVVPQDHEQKNVAALEQLIATHRVTHWISVPSAYAALLDHAMGEHLTSLRTAIVAGEECRTELVTRHREILPATELFNEYGPTEGSVWCSVYRICDSLGGASVPIGRPIPNARLYILDAHQDPVPIGIPGEVHIGGPGVAFGYLNRPELTAEKFIPDPFSAEPGARLYRTGDLARYLPDGNIEFLGRIDQQVKIRGFGIELSEIEGVLRQHPAVRDAVALVHEGTTGDRHIVAYLVVKREPAPAVSELRSFLRAKLPEYMTPSAFMILAALPLTPNGKVDRNALRPLVTHRSEGA